jgi:hypothetical protein
MTNIAASGPTEKKANQSSDGTVNHKIFFEKRWLPGRRFGFLATRAVEDTIFPIGKGVFECGGQH